MITEFALPDYIAKAVKKNHPKEEWDEVLRTELDIALLAKATQLAFVSAFQYGQDIPIAAVASIGNQICGRYAANDKRLGFSYLHAEQMTLMEAQLHQGPHPDTLTVTVEPCGSCIQYICDSGIKRIVFAVPRSTLSDLGLVNVREGIFTRDDKERFPLEIIQICDPEITRLNELLFQNTQRDRETGTTILNLDQIRQSLVSNPQNIINTSFLRIPKLQ